jgi:hypothetical protein
MGDHRAPRRRRAGANGGGSHLAEGGNRRLDIAAKIKDGRLLRPLSKSHKILETSWGTGHLVDSRTVILN